MKTSTRKRLGVALLVASPLVTLVLYICDVPLLSLQESHTDLFPNGSVTASVYKMHLPLLAVFIAAFLGLILLVLPGREKTNA
jgi:hypothetical protein